jgi:hypothetical protein
LNFRTVTEKLLTAFKEQNVEYALIGGYAVGLWGVARGTLDMDFLVRRDDLERLDRIMDGLGYELHHRSENVSQYAAPQVLFGEIDFIHAFRPHALRMLERAMEKTIFNDDLSVKVLPPEDLIGLKIQAIVNNERREHGDMHDIEELMRLHGNTMNWQLIEEYFAVFDRQELFFILKGTYHGAD